jgi:hypothetical protein
MTTKTLHSFLVGTLLAASTGFAGTSTEVTTPSGTQQAAFNGPPMVMALIGTPSRSIGADTIQR